jgi:hypothetical protein
MAPECEAGAAIYGAFQHLQPADLPFSLRIAPRLPPTPSHHESPQIARFLEVSSRSQGHIEADIAKLRLQLYWEYRKTYRKIFPRSVCERITILQTCLRSAFDLKKSYVCRSLCDRMGLITE